MKIFFGSDHAGFELKQKLIPFVRGLGYEVIDKGPDNLKSDDDYPDFLAPVAREVMNDKASLGIILGGSGQGEAMTANRFVGVRAAVYYGGPLDIIRLSREHNDANVLALGARFMTEEQAKQAVKIWLETPFSRETRHERRIKKIDSAAWGTCVQRDL
ncbi:MAG: RpiB/LacA/LacB family sugar-phosphate isomerase [Candidatus Paceibacterota bacterium]